MQPQLINHSPDLLKLWEAGYDMEINGDQHLLVHQIPYVNSLKEVKYGTLVCVLTLATPNRVGIPQDHTIYFTGETPCSADGIALNAIINNSSTKILANGITVNHYFSSKPITGNYPDYYEKIRTYAEILSVQAKVINDSVTSKPINRAA
ncbi:DUF6791 domain-containing protein [Flavobacterium oreochromis]|uniref:DUF6791 domain-containing protein n=1 Tax=Flavobacterium oreochromis TaxID=2906078 RepID=UPI00385C6C2F